MIYGFPKGADTPKDPHSAFTYLEDYPIDGGLVDGPVYTTIFDNLIGIELHNEDEYAEFQSDLVVYHDDFGDYSTNEPTMDGTASLIYLLAALEDATSAKSSGSIKKDTFGAIISGNNTKKDIALVFTAHDYDDGYKPISKSLKKQDIKAGFFLTGDYIKKNPSKVKKLYKAGHYIGPHSNDHLLYADWENRQTTVSEEEFKKDLTKNSELIDHLGINHSSAIFLPAYEWYT